jgi:hypothetical protein
MGLLGCLPPLDLRPDTLGAEEGARERLVAAAEAHGGLAAWEAKSTTELVLRDTWRGLPRLFNPWPSDEVRVHLAQRAHTFDSVATFLDADQGLVWGIEGGQAWRQRDGGAREAVDDADITFMLPTAQYFVEMPFRLLEAELFRDAGPEEIDGVVYDRVFLTWRSLEPNADFDQYVVYLDRDTGRIAKVAYTVREVFSQAAGFAHFDDLRQIDGIWIPHRMTIGSPGAPEAEWFHVMTIDALRFDSLGADLGPLPDLTPLVPR